jgi:uncharacterized protein (DUF924 family)
MKPDDILAFWFDELEPKQHFVKDAALDAAIGKRFAGTHAAAARGELYPWRDDAAGRLAEIIVLDQFSRNLYRDQARAFACDPVALVLAQELVRSGGDRELPPVRRAFAYMPYMHSESPRIHRVALDLFSQPGLEDNLKFERAHNAIIDRFGRYPHRNASLGRQSSAAEIAFLKEPGSSF